MREGGAEAVAAVDAVLPLRARDLERAQLLFRSLDAFFEPLGTCFVVAPDTDVETVRAGVPAHNYVVLPESRVVPELAWFLRTARLRSKLHIVGPPVHGWFVQQLVKLAIGPFVRTRFYLTLDSDVLCVRPTRYEDLVRDGRGIVQTAPPNHPEWNDDAERVLELPRSGRQYGVTPAVLSAPAVAALAQHLERRVSPRLRSLAAHAPHERLAQIAVSWRSRLLRQLPWTEYALYFTFLERTGLFDEHHVLAGEDAIYGNAVWMESQFDDWDPRAAFDAGNEYCFTIVQSATRISPRRVLERVAPFLERVDVARA